MNGLTTGRIVHYITGYNDQGMLGIHRPAVVVGLGFTDGECELYIFPTPMYSGYTVLAKYSEDKTLSTWHWIEKA